jgi:hypothetical protein
MSLTHLFDLDFYLVWYVQYFQKMSKIVISLNQKECINDI